VGAGSLWPWLPFLSPRTQKSVRLHILDDHIYQNAFSALVIINRFLEMPIFKKIICLKFQKLRKLQGKEKYQKMVETQEPIHYRKACIQ